MCVCVLTGVSVIDIRGQGYLKDTLICCVARFTQVEIFSNEDSPYSYSQYIVYILLLGRCLACYNTALYHTSLVVFSLEYCTYLYWYSNIQ